MKTVTLCALLILLISFPVQGRLLLTSKDGSVILDQSRFPDRLKTGVELLNGRCNGCHDLNRIIRALETGRTANGSAFGKAEAKEFITRKMRRPGVSLNQQEAREILQLMEYMLDEAPESRVKRDRTKEMPK